MMDYQIGHRLKAFRQRSNIKMPAIAAATGLAKETLYKWEKGTRPSNLNDYFKLKAYLDKMEHQLEINRLDMEDQKPATMRLPFSRDKLAVPQTDGKAAAGTVTVHNNEPELIVDRITAPFLGAVEGVVEVTGESMEPTFRNGCRIAVSRLYDNRIIEPGKYYYIIDYNYHGLVRRVYVGEDENSIKLISDNADQIRYPPIERNWQQIAGIFKVIASITKHQ
ncbi:LexA family transcriptional regulator [Longitalea luteola]|uniref:LexA family transcriptional regulator n=1 Tax=Longitalea luteola TaxID=2812563 RepID=UPI001A96A845|nr:LexA family transcriptional regulator [Longitalea luteola]